MNEQTDGELLAELGTDALKWAQQFAKVMHPDGTPWNEMVRKQTAEGALGYFANAIEAGRTAGRAQREVPGELLQVEALQAEIDSVRQCNTKLIEEVSKLNNECNMHVMERNDFKDENIKLAKLRDALMAENKDLRHQYKLVERTRDQLAQIIELVGKNQTQPSTAVTVNINGACRLTIADPKADASV